MIKLVFSVLAFVMIASTVYAGPAYDRNGNLDANYVTNGDGSISGYSQSCHCFLVRRGNNSWAYDSSGRVIATGRRRGNMQTQYDGNGRVIGKAVYTNSGNAIVYDRRSRVIGRHRMVNGTIYKQ